MIGVHAGTYPFGRYSFPDLRDSWKRDVGSRQLAGYPAIQPAIHRISSLERGVGGCFSDRGGPMLPSVGRGAYYAA